MSGSSAAMSSGESGNATGNGSADEKEKPVARSTLPCLLCGGVQIYPGPRYENHLVNEHGVIFDIAFIVEASIHKQKTGSVPCFGSSNSNAGDVNGNANGHDPGVDTEDRGIQTDEVPEKSDARPETKETPCQTEPLEAKSPKAESQPSASSILKQRLEQRKSAAAKVAESKQLDVSSDQSVEGESDGLIDVWVCPLCPKVFKKQTHFRQHMCIAHEMEQEDIASLISVRMSEEDFRLQKEAAEKAADDFSSPVGKRDGVVETVPNFIKRNPLSNNWAPNSFSSIFTCYFCNEQFPKDYKLKLHLMLNHKDESPEEMAKAKEALTSGKLDGCVHKCVMCGSKYNSVANFTRHIKEQHDMTRAQYREEYGSSEIVSRMFKCELCEKEVKHARNIIAAHMKMVHLISWKEYQDILIKMRQGEVVGDLPAPDLFECRICGVSVKYKREHLNKKHQITEEVYDELIEKKNRGEDISEDLPERETQKCRICDRQCLDMKKHLERTHQITEDVYEEMLDNREIVGGGDAGEGGYDASMMMTSSPIPKVRTEITSSSSSSSTDLHCPFGCDNETFKKDYQLHLHLKLKHRNEPAEELKRAYEAVEEEIALTRRSASVFQCALCEKQFNDNGAFYNHISSKHSMQWKDYKEQYGRCEVESAPFECKICLRVVKYDRNTVHTHLKNVHGINWQMYVERLRKIRNGEQPDELPQIEVTECKVCNSNVKYLREHLKNVHKITEQDYASLFKAEMREEQRDKKPPNGLGIGSAISVSRVPKQPATFKDENDGSSPNGTAASTPPSPPPKPPKSDIHDKTNKRCSSCNIAFVNRRGFIEHCTTVHNMKFKTKSGMTISAPSTGGIQLTRMEKPEAVEGTSSTQPLKRGANTPDLSPTAKKPKTVAAFEDSPPDTESTPHLGPQYTSTGVSKWNQCRYECCFCQKTTMSRSSMTSHIHHTHGIAIQDYKRLNYPDIEVETNWFQCRLCPTRTKFVKDCVAPHLKMSHNLEVEAYEKKYMQPEDWPATASGADLNYAAAGSDYDAAEATGGQVLSSRELAVRAVKEDKWNKCKFQCSICEWVSVDSRQMRAHIAAQHSLAYDKYVQQYGSAEVVTKKFRCELCSSEFKHCRQNIYAHMKDVHKISLQEYEDRVGMQEDGGSGDGGELFDQQQQMQVEFGQQQQQGSEYGTYEGPTALDERAMLETGHTPSRWNRCRFQCYLCKKMSSEKRHIREHIIKHHGISMPDYEANYGDCEVHTEYFFCGVCHAEVKHNLKNISLHLNNVHNMTPAAYEDQFGRLAEDEVVLGGSAQVADPSVEMAEQPEESANYNMGHFLTGDEEADDQNLDYDAAENPDVPTLPTLEDIKDPRCKFCRACNRDFNRRQAFVEHCRNIHSMKINFSGSSVQVEGGTAIPTKYVPPPRQSLTPKKQPVPAIASVPPTYPCEYCGKEFSNRSNRNRHKMLSCETHRAQLDGVGGSAEDLMDDSQVDERTPTADTEHREPVSREMKCPYPGCEVTEARSALMKRHLFEKHNIQQNVTVALPKMNEVKVKVEPTDSQERTTPNVTPVSNSSDDERRVPPLRVKLNGSKAEVRRVSSESGTEVQVSTTPPTAVSKEAKRCAHCSYANKNLYILDRHQKACLKRKLSMEATYVSEAETALEAAAENGAGGKDQRTVEEEVPQQKSTDVAAPEARSVTPELVNGGDKNTEKEEVPAESEKQVAVAEKAAEKGDEDEIAANAKTVDSPTNENPVAGEPKNANDHEYSKVLEDSSTASCNT